MVVFFIVAVSLLAGIYLYLRNVDRAVSTAHPEALKVMQKDWTKEDITEAYRRAQTSPTDVKPFLFPKRNRRYIVAGGSGLVGGWIVHHLLMRGEDPRAIRILDLSPTKRKEALEAKIDCVLTDVSNADAVNKAFNKPWPDHVKSWPLTVYHTVAYINAAERKADFLPMYVKVNISGTKLMLNAAKAAGATCFISTSSGSVGLSPPSYFPLPWQRWPKDIYQYRPNAEPKRLDAPLSSFGDCYAWSKAQAEKMVQESNDPQAGFLTGVIRPGHAIYGHGVENSSSLTWDYLRRGGAPTWLSNVVAHFVCAQNVSIGHLAYENALLTRQHQGGKGYLVTDPNPPIRYGRLYELLEQLADPSTPVKFAKVPHVVMILLAYTIEGYILLRHRYLSFLPKVTGDLAHLQPGTFNMCSMHLIYTDTAAQKEIGYRAPLTTLEGFALAVLDWNRNVDSNKKKRTLTSTTGAEVLAT